MRVVSESGTAFRAYGYTHLEMVSESENPPEGYTGNVLWNTYATDLSEWALSQPEGTLFRCVAWMPGENA